MVSNDLSFKVNAWLLEIFMCSTADSCTCGWFTAFLSRDVKPVYLTVDSCDSLERHLAFNLWRLFQFTELTEAIRQRVDVKFIDLLTKIHVGNIDDVQKQIREWFIEESDINYPENAQHMCAENYPTVKHNCKILDKLPGKTYTINTIDQIPTDCKYPATLISLSQNKKQSEKGGLAKCLELKVGGKVMVTDNVDIQDMLINWQIGEVAGFEIMNSIGNTYGNIKQMRW